MQPFPLVLSMTNFAHFQRCRKLFQYDALMNLVPRNDNDAATKGREFHEIMAVAHTTDGDLPDEWPGSPEMLSVAREYLRYEPLPEGRISAERGYFAEVGPNVWIRCSFDLVYLDHRGLCVRDYKTFSKAPSLDADLDFQSQAYLVVAEIALKSDQARFEWRYVRNELGRLLKAKKGDDVIYTPWEDHERYISQELMMTEEEREVTRRELYDCSLDILAAIDNERFYRTPLRGPVHGCNGCFHRDICKTERFKGTLSPEDLELLTDPYDPSDRVDPQTMEEDPRVRWYCGQGIKPEAAVQEVYGRQGRAKYEEMLARA